MADTQTATSEVTPSKFPKQSIFILIYLFFSGFGGIGITILLAVYFSQGLYMSDDDSLIVFHVYMSVKTIFPLLGAIVADSLLGKFKTIVLGMIVYGASVSLLTVSTLTTFGLSPVFITGVALFFIALGSGATVPCMAALGGDQFNLPEQEKQLSLFFQIYYWALNLGSIIGTLLLPELRKFKCFDKDNCYPLAFFVPTVILIGGFVIFLLGGHYYRDKRPKENMIVVTTKCFAHALVRKCKSTEKKEHWLDHASDKFDQAIIDDIKLVLKLFIVYAVMPIFWCLFNQQNSDWTLLAAKLDGNIGFFTILPEQIQSLNPVLVVILLPMFHSFIDPFFIKINFCATPLKRMALGFFLASFAFMISAAIYFLVYKDLPTPPAAGTIEIRAYNPENSSAEISIEGIDNLTKISLDPFDKKEWLNVKFTGSKKDVSFNEKMFKISEGKAYALCNFANGVEVVEDIREKPKKDSFPRVMPVMASQPEVEFKSTGKHKSIKWDAKKVKYIKIEVGTYKLQTDSQQIDETIHFKIGGVYLVMANFELNKLQYFVIIKENTISMLWLTPQYILITISEVLVSVTLLEFSYSHAPLTMKSFLQAIRALTVSVGNGLVVLITLFKFVHHGYNAIIYAVLIILDMFLLLWIQYKYKYKVVERASLSL